MKCTPPAPSIECQPPANVKLTEKPSNQENYHAAPRHHAQTLQVAECLVYERGCVDADLNFVVVNKQAKAKLVKRMLKNSMARKDKGDDGGSGNID